MFTYWKGYEVDGSSTTYNIVVPQRKLVTEVISYFINLNIIDRKAKIRLSYKENSDIAILKNKKHSGYINEEFKAEEVDRLCDLLEKPTLKNFSISTECVHPDKLYHELRKELYNLSKSRPGAEDREYHYTDPTASDLSFDPALGVTMGISFYDEEEPIKDYEAKGLIFNGEALVNNLRNPHFTINFDCGPSFIYEYAAYIVSKLAERFPEIGIDGGIDCAGGFINGCTYSCSLYAYERITLTTENIAEAINYLIKDLNIEPQKRTGYYGYDSVSSNRLYLYNAYDIDKTNDVHLRADKKIIKKILSGKKELTPQQYEAFAKRAAAIGMVKSIDFMHYCVCQFKVEEQYGTLTCLRENNRVWLQLRVAPERREQFVKRLKAGGFDIR